MKLHAHNQQEDKSDTINASITGMQFKVNVVSRCSKLILPWSWYSQIINVHVNIVTEIKPMRKVQKP